jgi:alpha-tubulin suppressor-like RCC1 family protein
MEGLAGVQQLVAGDSHICALMAAGTVACWGYNGMGELGIGADVVASTTPVTVPDLTGVIEVAAGGQSTCARRSDGEVFCWGSNIPGDGSKVGSPVPIQVRW